MTTSNVSKLQDGTYKFFLTNYEKCNKANRRLKQYRDGKSLYKFQEGEEGIFVVKDADLLKICKVLGIALEDT